MEIQGNIYINIFRIGYIYYKNESNQQVNFETNLVNKGGCKLTKPERGYYFKSFIPP